MSWPSSYGYKYTPIGLRQREHKDNNGSRCISTTVHLPQGGHLLDIERAYGLDGSMSKRVSRVDRRPSPGVTPLYYLFGAQDWQLRRGCWGSY